MKDTIGEKCGVVDEDDDKRSNINAMRWDIHKQEGRVDKERFFGACYAPERGGNFLDLCEV